MTSDVRDLFIAAVLNAHALEAEAMTIMRAQVGRLDDYGELKARISAHMTETEEQSARLEKILAAVGEDTSSLKDAAASVMGQFAALGHMLAEDEVLKNLFADVAFENFEISAYTSLLQIAEAGGFEIAIQPLRTSLKEEEAMSEWLKANIKSTTQRYLELHLRAAA